MINTLYDFITALGILVATLCFILICLPKSKTEKNDYTNNRKRKMENI